MKTSISRIAAATITFLSLTACTGGSDESKQINYPKDGERATLDSITGVWEDTLNRSDGSLDLSYVVIRDDGTYIQADYHGTALSGGQVNCYDISESTITELLKGLFSIGESDYHIFTYEDSMGYYEVNLGIGLSYLAFEYDRLANTETEMSFEPVCEG